MSQVFVCVCVCLWMCLMFENISSGFFMHRMQLTLHIKSISKLTKKYFFGERARACEWSKANTEKVPKIRTIRKHNKYAWIQIRFIHLFTFDASRFEHLILFSADLFTRPLASIFFPLRLLSNAYEFRSFSLIIFVSLIHTAHRHWTDGVGFYSIGNSLDSNFFVCICKTDFICLFDDQRVCSVSIQTTCERMEKSARANTVISIG